MSTPNLDDLVSAETTPTDVPETSKPTEATAGMPGQQDEPGQNVPATTQRGHAYQAVVTAHFPNSASIAHAREALEQLGLPPATYTVQWLEKDAVENEWGDRQPGLDAGVTAFIIQLADAQWSEKLVHLCEAAGATRVTAYAAQRMTW